jgi:hypothetical protein
VKNAGKKADVQDVSDSESDAQPKRRKRVAAVEKAMTQTELKVFKGIDIPFSQSQIEMLHAQFLHATISANLPFRWVENPKVIKLFLMFRSAAGDIIPGRRVLSGRLLKDEATRIDKNVKVSLRGEYVMISYVSFSCVLILSDFARTDGWKGYILGYWC